ncbi:MAG: hypothetical protein IT318_18940 [Anaerolineales bacterium]|nr:hypothetical protein [Anaerolineales bacterium]
MVIYTVCACDRCGAAYASFWRASAGVVMFYRLIDLEHAVAEVRPQEPMTCTQCGGALAVTIPYAVRTGSGDWLALDLKQVERALVN